MTPGRLPILTVEALADEVRAAQRRGERVVLCHGCFDIVHPGHVRHLQQAARLGERLVVTVTGDRDVGKGADRPLIPQELRAENLAALDVVDWVAINPHATAVSLLEIVRPDIYVKGREYETNDDPRFEAEKRVVQAHGGRVVFSSGDVVFSSTALIGAMEASSDPGHAALRRVIAQQELDDECCAALLNGFSGRRVLVMGETIIDTYVHCDQPELASESPMMTLRPLEHHRYDGGAAIIARQIAAMGARPTLLTALPRSRETESMRLRLEVEGVEMITIDCDQPLMEKQRFLVGTNKLMKLDAGERLILDDDARTRAIALAADAAQRCDAAIVTDFGLGFYTPRMLGEIARRVRPHVELLIGDVSGRRSNLLALREFDVLTPSESELRSALHDHDDGLGAVVSRLLQQTASRAAIVTLGRDGLIAFSPRDVKVDDWNTLHADHVPSTVRHAVDPLGCGDSLLAATTLALLAGAPLPTAALIGTVAAGVQARRLGNAVVGAADLRRGVQQLMDTRLTFEPAPVPAPSDRR